MLSYLSDKGVLKMIHSLSPDFTTVKQSSVLYPGLNLFFCVCFFYSKPQYFPTSGVFLLSAEEVLKPTVKRLLTASFIVFSLISFGFIAVGHSELLCCLTGAPSRRTVRKIKSVILQLRKKKEKRNWVRRADPNLRQNKHKSLHGLVSHRCG